MIPVWILTFNRPMALNRLISKLGKQGFDSINVLSNHPVLDISEENQRVVSQQIINTLNCEESNSWCARSWNTILTKAFDQHPAVICLQDDTDISDNFGNWISQQSENYDFIWGPQGDQFFYLTLDVMRKVGFWDERFIGCYCGDADFLKRCFFKWDKARMSIEEGHHWGFQHNPSGIRENILVALAGRAIDKTYENQHWEFKRKGMTTITRSENYYQSKWNARIQERVPIIRSHQQVIPEIDWYPWFSKKHDVDQSLFG